METFLNRTDRRLGAFSFCSRFTSCLGFAVRLAFAIPMAEEIWLTSSPSIRARLRAMLAWRSSSLYDSSQGHFMRSIT